MQTVGALPRQVILHIHDQLPEHAILLDIPPNTDEQSLKALLCQKVGRNADSTGANNGEIQLDLCPARRKSTPQNAARSQP